MAYAFNIKNRETVDVTREWTFEDQMDLEAASEDLDLLLMEDEDEISTESSLGVQEDMTWGIIGRMYTAWTKRVSHMLKVLKKRSGSVEEGNLDRKAQHLADYKKFQKHLDQMEEYQKVMVELAKGTTKYKYDELAKMLDDLGFEYTKNRSSSHEAGKIDYDSIAKHIFIGTRRPSERDKPIKLRGWDDVKKVESAVSDFIELLENHDDVTKSLKSSKKKKETNIDTDKNWKFMKKYIKLAFRGYKDSLEHMGRGLMEATK